MPTLHSEGTQSATISTEFTLTGAETVAGFYVFTIDCFNMASGDTLEIRFKNMAKASGTQREMEKQTIIFANITTPIIQFPAVLFINDWDISIKQTAGTARNYDWSIWKV